MNEVKTIFKEYKPELKQVLQFFGWGIFLGAIFAVTSLRTPTNLFNFINPIYKDITDKVSAQNPQFLPLFLAILQRNTTAMLIIILSGLIHRIFPKLVILFNGFLIGVVIWLLAVIGRIFALWMLIPHGIFEIPALFLATAYGISLTTKVEKRGIPGKYQALIKQKRLFIYIVGLLIIAAIIESSSIVLF